MSTPSVPRLYRTLLRAATNLRRVNNNTAWLRHVQREFREPSAGTAERRLLAAREAVAMIDSITEYERLLNKYNIGVAIDERERIRKTAARVGFAIPEFYEADNESAILEKYQNALDADSSSSSSSSKQD